MKLFQELDEGFYCEHCYKMVSPLEYSSRDHCPYCLYSKHVDENPGDRLNTCHGLLKPIDIEKYRDTYKIIYQCEKCKKLHKNIIARDDDLNEIIKISSHNNG